MQGNVTSQVEREELIIRHAPRPRPRTPRRGPWQGQLPQGVERIVKRDALDHVPTNLYANWASSFALLTDAFIGEIVKSASPVPARLPVWTSYKWFECCSCQVGDNYMWVQKHDSGWTIELCYPDTADPDSFVLAFQNMPVLCPDQHSAVTLAVACYPVAAVNLTWEPYW